MDTTKIAERISQESPCGNSPNDDLSLLTEQDSEYNNTSQILRDLIKKYITLKILGLNKDAKELAGNSPLAHILEICDCSSNNGIPDPIMICILKDEKLFGTEEELHEYKKESLQELIEDSQVSALLRTEKDSKETIKIPVKRQTVSTSCNQREDRAITTAAVRSKLSRPQYIAHACLYMSRFINLFRRKGTKQAYTPGEAFLLMQHGRNSLSSFTPDEVTGVLKSCGVNDDMAEKIMKELELKRDQRKKEEMINYL